MGQGRTGRRGALFVIADRFTRDQGGTAPLVEGFYLLNLNRARRVSIPVRIWFGPPLDPETREEMDRARSEEHTSEIKSLMRFSDGDLCLKKQQTQCTD